MTDVKTRQLSDNELILRYQEGDAYRFDEAELEAFDAQFPPREKHVLPGQLP